MGDHGKQNLKNEEGAEAPEVEAAQATRGKKVAAAPIGHERDFGEWKYQPWFGHDHWVHERTGASTFSLKTNK